jgi:hypothetical protein
MARITTAQADVAQNAVIGTGTTYYLSLHTTDPGTAGSGEGTDGRKAITFASSSGGSQSSSNSQSWTSAVGGQTYPYFGIYTAVTAGTYMRGGTLTSSITPAAGATISVATGAIVLTAS